MLEDIKRWLAFINLGGTFARTNETKTLVEKQTAEEWARSVRAKYGLVIEAIEPHQPDPPDCTAVLADRTITIELTELTDGAVRALIAASQKTARPLSRSSPKLFDRSQWTKARFLKAIRERIAKKAAQGATRQASVDVLIIHTDEAWLLPEDVEAWLSTERIEPVKEFGSAYLLMSYDPGRGDSWPVFRLF